MCYMLAPSPNESLCPSTTSHRRTCVYKVIIFVCIIPLIPFLTGSIMPWTLYTCWPVNMGQTRGQVDLGCALWTLPYGLVRSVYLPKAYDKSVGSTTWHDPSDSPRNLVNGAKDKCSHLVESFI